MPSLLKHSQKALLLLQRGHADYVAYRGLRLIRALRRRVIGSRQTAFKNSANSISGEALKRKIESVNSEFTPHHKWAVVLHLYYPELFFEMMLKPFFQEKACDFYISLPQSIDEEMIDLIKSTAGNAKFYVFENKGRDVLPFLKILPELGGYEWIGKAHSKKSPEQYDGELWREDLYNSLFGSKVKNKLQTSRLTVSMFAPYQTVLDADLFMAGNRENMESIFETLKNSPKDFRFPFVAGTMFWVRPRSLAKLAEATWSLYFTEERGLRDGDMAHAFERIFAYVATRDGGKLQSLPSA